MIARPTGDVRPAAPVYREVLGAKLLLHGHRGAYDSGVHAHEAPLVTCLLDGATDEVDERGRSRRMSSGGLSLTPTAMLHAHVQRSEAVRCLCVLFGPPMQRLAADSGGALERPTIQHRSATARIATRIADEISATDDAAALIVQGLLIEMIGELSRAAPEETEAPRWLRLAAEMLRDGDVDRLSVQQVADEVAVHPSHLIRAFRVHFGTTPGDYARQMRLERCRTEVRKGDLPLKAIAARAGFADAAHFSREFRKAFGVTPSNERRATTTLERKCAT